MRKGHEPSFQLEEHAQKLTYFFGIHAPYTAHCSSKTVMQACVPICFSAFNEVMVFDTHLKILFSLGSSGEKKTFIYIYVQEQNR